MSTRPTILMSIVRAAALAGLVLHATGAAKAETVVALPGAECKEVRQTLSLIHI